MNIQPRMQGAIHRMKKWLRRSGVEDTGKQVIDKSLDLGKEAISKSKEALDHGYKTVTLKTYREQVDSTLSEIVEVLSAHEAEILALREKVKTLESQAGIADSENPGDEDS